jgi:hypothetical protein
MKFLKALRFFGTEISKSPLRYLAVSELISGFGHKFLATKFPQEYQLLDINNHRLLS